MADRAYVAHDESATVQWIDSKIIVGKTFPFAIAISGTFSPHAVTRHLERLGPRNPRALCAALLDATHAMEAEAIAEGVEPQQSSFCCFAAVWSARTKAAGVFAIGNGKGFGGRIPAYQACQLDWSMGSAGQPSDALGRDVDMSDPASFDVRRDGVAMMEWQRRNEIFDYGHGPAYGIGGGIDLVTVDVLP